MKRLLWAVLALLLMHFSLNASANTITTIVLSPNDGSGDNFFFSQQSPGLTIEAFGGAPFEFFNTSGYTPESSIGGFTDVFFDFGFIVTGGVSHDLIFNGTGSLFMSGLAIPPNGAATVTLPVELTFGFEGINADTLEVLDVFGEASGTVTFTLSDGVYFAQTITTTNIPEPGMLSLLGTGVVGIFLAARSSVRRC